MTTNNKTKSEREAEAQKAENEAVEAYRKYLQLFGLLSTAKEDVQTATSSATKEAFSILLEEVTMFMRFAKNALYDAEDVYLLKKREALKP